MEGMGSQTSAALEASEGLIKTGSGSHSLSFFFRRSGIGPENMHFSEFPGNVEDHTLRTIDRGPLMERSG